MLLKTLINPVMYISKVVSLDKLPLKRLINIAFWSSEPFNLLRLMGISVLSLHRESNDFQILSSVDSISMVGPSRVCALPNILAQ